ncbi:MAG: SDR family oxidoreductase [Chloroflexi bacterium]|nr:SDR family oxidoreductase [Chloroflexota bacterium]
MKVLVTGGAGYVGGAVTDLLTVSQHTVRVYDALLYEESYRKPVDFVCGDVRDTEKLLPHLMWADAVIWLAALVGDGACALNPDISVSINQAAVKWLTEHYDGRIIFMSTCSVYGAQDTVLDEASPTKPLSVYAATKLAAEQHLQGRNSIIFRLGTLFGVSDNFARIRLDLVVNTLTVRAHRQGKISVFGGDQFRPLLHVKDAARAAVDNLGTTATGIFNIARQNVRIIDLAYQVRNHFPDLVIEQTPMMFQDTRNYRVSSEKAQKTLGFKSLYSIDDGIDELKELLDSCRLKDADNPRYTNQAYLSMFNTHKLASAVKATEVKK